MRLLHDNATWAFGLLVAWSACFVWASHEYGHLLRLDARRKVYLYLGSVVFVFFLIHGVIGFYRG